MYKRPVLGTIVFICFKFMKTAWKIYKEYYLYYISTKYWFNLGNIIFCLELSLGSTHDFWGPCMKTHKNFKCKQIENINLIQYCLQ